MITLPDDWEPDGTMRIERPEGRSLFPADEDALTVALSNPGYRPYRAFSPYDCDLTTEDFVVPNKRAARQRKPRASVDLTDQKAPPLPDTPLRLDEAARIAFPAGGMTASGLRREARVVN